LARHTEYEEQDTASDHGLKSDLNKSTLITGLGGLDNIQHCYVR